MGVLLVLAGWFAASRQHVPTWSLGGFQDVRAWDKEKPASVSVMDLFIVMIRSCEIVLDVLQEGRSERHCHAVLHFPSVVSYKRRARLHV